MQTAGGQTVDRLEAALALAERLGYRIRMESLWGESGGGCEIRGQKWLFIDLSLTPREQLEQVLPTLRHEAARIKAASADQPRGARILRCAQNDGAAQNDSATESTETSANREVSAAPPKSSPGFLPRWRRWYRMVVGSQPKAAQPKAARSRPSLSRVFRSPPEL